MTELHVRVRRHLDASAVPYVVHDHAALPVAISSPADFASALGYPVDRIMKTLICHVRSTGALVAMTCPVDVRVDFKRVATELGCGRIEVVSTEQLETATGYPRLGVSPLGLDGNITVAMARQSFGHDTVLVGGGAAGVEVELAPHDLQRITGAVPIDLG
ncbi:aminoacyl-tRNA deacylase [Mycolicibacterium sp. CBMA 226]|uniref:aminoacyl-tRNA deacylase n=1 Tax=Mycolicibacterium sp. CBMA 226 TaxID=2606611 RepID=UPI0012DE1ACE|nr:YbaK/EbsC family protein [Mycolicibacterium sp. CBMA 226]MUL79482.1 Cys-tRNA(Pro) deacylase [Mycolicibacterium sp. CBMA 226]